MPPAIDTLILFCELGTNKIITTSYWYLNVDENLTMELETKLSILKEE